VSPIRVALAEDHTIVREGLAALLESVEDIRVVSHAADGRDAVALAREHKPDVIVMDVGMPGLNGVDATRIIRSELPSTRVVILSMHKGEEYVVAAVRAGADGYLLKGSGLSDLVRAVREVAQGNAFFSPEVAMAIVRDRRHDPNELTGREREVLQLVAEGKSSKEVAQLLELSVKTVEGHRGRMMQKLGATNVADLVRHAVRLGLVDVA
jgi:DNA-binding NarL/FixJ family response regulator